MIRQEHFLVGEIMPPDESDSSDKAEAYDILMGVVE